jgi:hypothetical protein
VTIVGGTIGRRMLTVNGGRETGTIIVVKESKVGMLENFALAEAALPRNNTASE